MADPELSYSRLTHLPERPIQRLQRPLIAFTHIESASGILLLVCTAIALVAANSPMAEAYAAFWNHEFSFSIADFELAYPLWYWVNDGLMPIFFFVIGLEIKRELVIGELSDPKKVVLPVAAAIGGVVIPVAIYLALQGGGEGQRGWAVPMATDIAFVVGCLSLLGKRVPYGVTVLMLSLAIVDDLAAVLVIALFYTTTIKVNWLVGAAVGLVAVAAMNRLGVRRVGLYVVVGTGVWLCTLKSGIHPTIAGVALGLMTPAMPWLGGASFMGFLRHTHETLRKEDTTLAKAELMVADLAFASREAVAPLSRIERALHPWTAFAIMPVFALANAGVPVAVESISTPVGLAIAGGLFIGKAVGIFGASWITVKLGWAERPAGVTWPILLGAAFLGGIGFTMALFIASLGLSGDLLVAAKIGVIMGSFCSAVVGMLILVAVTKKA
ncbi:MAG: Na+/H+ antiporter NhaA [Deltaproteobacteria bacterium]|jgi:NhaA family Na+:H+ antiporter|nr:Na+/H+ antiporter NhaA [Deltaproteobacteria bacterium]